MDLKKNIHHGIRITDDALVAAAKLTDRYINDRFLPDKAIDVTDEAASLSMQSDSKPEALDLIDRSILQLKIEQAALQKEPTSGDQNHRLEQVTTELGKLEADLKHSQKSGKLLKPSQKKLNNFK